jgi:MFS family permease
MLIPKVLYNREFLKLWLAQVFSQFSLNILNFALIIKVYEATFSNTSVSLLLLAFGLPGLLFGYMAGSYVDKVNTKNVLTVTNVIRSLTVTLLIFFPNQPSIYYLVALIISLASQFFIPAEGSLIPSLVKKDDLLQANSFFTISLYTMTITGFLFAGPLLNLFEMAGTAVIILVGFLLALVLTLWLPLQSKVSDLRESFQFVTRLVLGLKFVYRAKEVRHALFFLTLTQTIFLVIATVAPGFLNQYLKLSAKETSLVLVAPAAVGLLFGSYSLHHLTRKYSKRHLVDAGIIGLGLTIAAFTTTEIFDLNIRVGLTVLLAFLLGVQIAYINIPATTALQEDTEEDLRGRMYGLLVSLQSGASLFPIILAGALADLFGVSFVLRLIGLGVLGLGLYRLRHHLKG